MAYSDTVETGLYVLIHNGEYYNSANPKYHGSKVPEALTQQKLHEVLDALIKRNALCSGTMISSLHCYNPPKPKEDKKPGDK